MELKDQHLEQVLYVLDCLAVVECLAVAEYDIIAEADCSISFGEMASSFSLAKRAPCAVFLEICKPC